MATLFREQISAVSACVCVCAFFKPPLYFPSVFGGGSGKTTWFFLNFLLIYGRMDPDTRRVRGKNRGGETSGCLRWR